MHDDMHDDLDEPLRGMAARSYHSPDGAVPREEMWARIAAARRAARATPAPASAPAAQPVVVDTPVIPIGSRQRTIWRWSAALAAGLVLGVVVDRTLVGRSGAERDAIPQHVALTGTRGSPSVVATPAPSIDSTVSATPRTLPAPSQRVAVTPTPAPRSSSSESSAASARVERSGADPRDLYHAAAVQTLVQAEALLTAYRRGDAAPDPQAMQQAARWARDVLSSTRLLMDSPAARDPQMRALFSDLELVLVQVVQLSGAPLQAAERDLIERALRDRDLLPRLRSAVPAGVATS